MTVIDMGPVTVPGWLVKSVVTAIVGLLVTGAAAWGVNLSSAKNNHETRISVTETNQKNIMKSLDEIKETQAEQARDTKEILKRLPKEER